MEVNLEEVLGCSSPTTFILPSAAEHPSASGDDEATQMPEESLPSSSAATEFLPPLPEEEQQPTDYVGQERMSAHNVSAHTSIRRVLFAT